MQNYNDLLRKQQQDYQATRDPFAYGNQVARRRYSEIMAGLEAQKKSTNLSYSDMYQAARQTAVGERAQGSPTLSGGMKAQYSDLISTREMQQLGQIGAAQNQALRDIELQGQSAFSNAQVEGQQATQMGIQDQQTKLGIITQKNQILADKELTNAEKAEQLDALGYVKEAADLRLSPDKKDASIPKWLQSMFGFGAAGVAAKALAAGGPVGWAILGIGGLIFGVDKLGEQLGWRDGKGLFDLSELGI